MSRRILIPGAAVVSGMLLVSFGIQAADRPDPQTKVVEEIVAKVNGDIITRGELEQARTEIETELKQRGAVGAQLEGQMKQMIDESLREQIDQLLLVQKGKELNIKVDADLNKQIAAIQLQTKIADPEKFHDLIRQETGTSYEDFRQKMQNKLLTERVVSEEVWRTVVIPKADMEKYYNEHKADFIRKESVTLREIQITTGDNSPAVVAAAEKKAKGLVERARGGEKFTDLARQNSDNNLTAVEDGFLGTSKRGELSKAIEDIVFKQEKGYITDPIRIPGCCFEILRVDEHINEGQATFDEVQGEINQRLAEPLVTPKLRDYLATLRKNAFIQIKPGYVDTGAVAGKDTSWKDPTQLRPETTTKAEVANRRHLKKLLGIIPYGMTGGTPAPGAATPTVTPVQQTPVKTPDGNAVK